MRITRVETTRLRLPAAVRGRVALGAPPAALDVVAVRLHTDGEVVGHGLTCLAGPGAAALHHLVEAELAPLLVGEDCLRHERLFAKAKAHFRAAGWAGLPARAYAAVDLALWDAKAKSAGLPLHRLLGGARDAAPFFVGDVAPLAVEPDGVVKAAKPLLQAGALGVLVEVGCGDVQQDADRVTQIREGLGEGAWLGVTAAGRYDLGTALALGQFLDEDVGADWFESPLPDDDRDGYRRLAARSGVPLAVGASLDGRDEFRARLEAGDVRVLRPDVLRLGGLTPLLKLAAAAEAYPVVLVPSRWPEVNIHVACGLPGVPLVEHGGWLAGVLADPPRVEGGKLVPPGRPGAGLELAADAAERFPG